MATKKQPEKKRRGKAVKPKKGEAAQFKAGGAAAPKEFDAAAIAEDLNLWWENGDGQSYLLGDPDTGSWSKWPEKKVVNLMRAKHWVTLRPRDGETLSEADRVLLHTMKYRRLEMSISALAGYSAGVHDISGQKMLVCTSPVLVEPKAGEWKIVRGLIDSKLNLSLNGRGPDQTVYFHGWMKTALEAIYKGGPGNFRPGQCCIFAGPKDSGKSRIQHQIITGLLGGRSADPGPYLFGRTDFNSEMFAAEHLMMEDPASSTKTVDRVFFGEMLKQLVVNDTQRLHQKREDAMIVSPFFRTTISVNDDPDKMRVLPLLTPDMKDKVNLFLISDQPLPMPTLSLDERAEFRKRIAAELPAYAYWLLNEFEIPETHRSGRFGCKEWHHPGLAMELFDDTPAAELLQILDAAEFNGRKLWELKSDAQVPGVWLGSAIELERLLLNDTDITCTLEREAKKLCMHNKMDRLLGRLKEDQPDRVAPHRTNAKRGWMISLPVT